MQINLQVHIHIHIDRVELDRTLAKVLALLAPQAAETPQDTIQGPDTHAPSVEAQGGPILPATQATDTAAPLPTLAKKKTSVAKRTALLPGALGGLPQPEPKQRNMTTARLPFAELDALVRSEMKRLGMDKRMPGHTLWNAERDPRLPTLTAICYRYNVSNLVELAAKLGMQPPLSATLEQVGGKVEP